MNYFQDVLGEEDTSQIVPYVQQRADFLSMVVAQWKSLMEQALFQCPKRSADGSLTPMQAQDCLLQQVASFQTDCVRKGMSPAECSILPRLADDLLRKALECGATPCSLSQMQDRFAQAAGILQSELSRCRLAFATQDAECVASFAKVIQLKKQERDQQRILASDTRPILRKELSEEMRRSNEFVASQQMEP